MNNNAAFPILYSFRRCPYAMRARMAIYASGLEVELREVVLRDKPPSMLEASPKGSVPVLILTDGQVLEESLDIVEYTLGQNDPDDFLKCDTALTKELIKENDGPFKRALDRYKYPNRYEGEDVSMVRDTGEAFLKKLDALLQNSANLTSDHISMTDICIFPFVRQFANTDREWFEALPYSALQNWLRKYLESALFKAIMPKYDQWKKGDTPVIFGASPLRGACGS